MNVSQSSIHDNAEDGIFNLMGGSLSVANTSFQNNYRALLLSPAVDFTHSGNTATNNNINGIVMNGNTIADSGEIQPGLIIRLQIQLASATS